MFNIIDNNCGIEGNRVFDGDRWVIRNTHTDQKQKMEYTCTEMNAFSSGSSDVTKITNQTLENVKNQFDRLQK